MTNKNVDLNEAEMDAVFAQMRTDTPAPSDALLSRVMADADGVIARNGAKPATSGNTAAGIWQALTDIGSAIGGWTAFAGLGTAAVAGVWIGVAQPVLIAPVSDLFLFDTTTSAVEDFMPGLDSIVSGG